MREVKIPKNYYNKQDLYVHVEDVIVKGRLTGQMRKILLNTTVMTLEHHGMERREENTGVRDEKNHGIPRRSMEVCGGESGRWCSSVLT